MNKKKIELKKKYNEYKEKIIKSTDEEIEKIKKTNLIVDFKEIITKIKKIILDKLNKLKQETKNKLEKLTSKIPLFFDEFIQTIDKILNLNFCEYNNQKLTITQCILNFILDIEAGNINIKKNNKKNKEDEKELEKLLFNYLTEKLQIEDINIKEIIKLLFKKGLKELLNKTINSVINLGKNKLFHVKNYYNIFSEFIMDYISIIKVDAVEFLEESKELLNLKIDKGFDYFIKYINFLFSKAITISEIINIKFKNIWKFKNNLMDNLKKLKDITIAKITTNFEQMMENLEKECDKQIYKLKSIANQKINGFVDKYENKIFGYINNIFSEENNNSKNNHKKTKKIKTKENLEQNNIENNFNQNNKLIKNNEENINSFDPYTNDLKYDNQILNEGKSNFGNI